MFSTFNILSLPDCFPFNRQLPTNPFKRAQKPTQEEKTAQAPQQILSALEEPRQKETSPEKSSKFELEQKQRQEDEIRRQKELVEQKELEEKLSDANTEHKKMEGIKKHHESEAWIGFVISAIAAYALVNGPSQTGNQLLSGSMSIASLIFGIKHCSKANEAEGLRKKAETQAFTLSEQLDLLKEKRKQQ